jgi:prolyl oligopeptidase
MEKIEYFETRKGDYIDTYGDNKVEDPYQWLEDPDSEETKKWVTDQITLTSKYIDSALTVRKDVAQRMTELYNYPKYGCPAKHGNKYYFAKNDGLQNQYVTFVQDTLTSEPQEFFNPNKLSEDGTISKTTSSFSESGDYYAYGLSKSGSDWNTFHVKTCDPSHPMANSLTESLEWVKFSGISWTHDDKGFFYSRYPAQKEDLDRGTETTSLANHSLYYHYIGTKQDQDVLIYNMPDQPKWNVGGEVTNDGKYLCITISQDCNPEHLFYYYKLDNFAPKKEDSIIEPTKLIDTFEACYGYVTNEGSLFYFLSNLDAPSYKLITIDLASPDRSNYKDIIPTHSKDVMENVQCIYKNKILVSWQRDVKDVLEMYSMDGKLLRSFDLELGSLGVSGSYDKDEVFIAHTSFLSPSTIYHFKFSSTDDLHGSAIDLFRKTDFEGFDSSKFVIEQVFYPSKDGTKIPMFLVHSKSLKKDGNNPVYLYGYGGFNISLKPSFSALRLSWLDNFGGVYACPNLRGGGEYGKVWHESGQKGKKQNVFDDFQAAAEYLIAQGYTTPAKLSIHGGSNGGLLVAACLNQRPDLFACGVAAVGVLDMLKYHKFGIGHFWTSDYGSSDNAEDFEYLIKYSPLHNISKDKAYPAVMLTTGDHDDRVSPLHSFKYIAALQNELAKNENQKAPLLIRIEAKAGHGAGKPTTKIINEHADVYAFVAKHTNATWTESSH